MGVREIWEVSQKFLALAFSKKCARVGKISQKSFVYVIENFGMYKKVWNFLSNFLSDNALSGTL